MSLGLKKDSVILEPHQEEWDIEGQNICAKPIIDIAVAVKSFQDFMKHDEELKENGIIYRKQDVPGQHLYRSGNLDNDIVTHYIHIVISDSETWNNYINFRDYLNNNKEEALRYENLKMELCAKFPNDRDSYVNGKHELITELLAKARIK